ncbi:hypothetical protein CRUP_002566, partial [Coryphaenoides rupestris]
WVCQFCTYLNYSPSTVCEICDLARPEPAPMPVKLRPPSPVRRVPALPVKPKNPPTEDPEHRRQRQLQEEGLRLIQLIRATSCPGEWLRDQLPPLLDHICELVAPSPLSPRGNSAPSTQNGLCEPTTDEGGKQSGPPDSRVTLQLSRAEAKQAWLTAGGDTDRAARQALRDRCLKVKELCSLGFEDESLCHEVLRQSRGELRGAAALLHAPLL